jgi:hypothetical protein
MSALLGDKKKYADKAAKAQELNDLVPPPAAARAERILADHQREILR